ncbi:hypothetical protein MesoLj113a_73220 [Mesorhizobium sp. 113-1-2]|nr:hypothetical protein MesoLj113a_73220 [Mesorhizobium sp. 113-1-2]
MTPSTGSRSRVSFLDERFADAEIPGKTYDSVDGCDYQADDLKPFMLTTDEIDKYAYVPDWPYFSTQADAWISVESRGGSSALAEERAAGLVHGGKNEKNTANIATTPGHCLFSDLPWAACFDNPA